MHIRLLGPEDAAAYQALRLEGLQAHPAAFSASYEGESKRSPEQVAARLSASPEALVSVFGAFIDGGLYGVTVLERTAAEKLAHNAWVCGVYVTASARQRGVGGALLDAVIAYARGLPHLRHLKLSVNAANMAAIALYRSRGFTAYGLEREFLCVEGVYHDEEFYGLRIGHEGLDHPP